MLVEIGHFGLAAAFVAALMQALTLLPQRQLHVWSRGAATAQSVALTAAFVALIAAFATSDFSARIIATNSHTLKPFFYKISAAWGNHEGSMLLWALVLSVYGGVLARTDRIDPDIKRAAVGILGLLGAGVCLFLIVASNPFERVSPAPFEGKGLNPLLQDPALVIHPPILYAGYVGFAAPYALAMAALLTGKANRAFASVLVRWSLAPVALLTLGVGLGSWWAYRELGWGGYWFWDPVENASLMPWLAGVSGLHLALLWSRTGQFANLTLFTLLSTFALSVLGTFIVRSGSLTSVHAFAVDPLRGTLILFYLGAVVGAAVYAFHKRERRPITGLKRTPSRELILLSGASLLGAATITVMLGTLYPLLIEGLGLEPLTVGAPYFNQTAAPMMGLAFILLAIAPDANWGGAGGARALARPIGIAFGGGLIAALGSWVLTGLSFGEALLIGVALTLPILVIHHAIRSGMRQWGMVVAHAGMAIATVGMIGSSALSSEITASVSAGSVVETKNVNLVFGEVGREPKQNFISQASIVEIRNPQTNELIGTLTPERRWYPAEDMVTTEAAIRSTAFADLYITLGDLRAPGATEPDWALRVRHRPFISWIWLGVVITFLGSIQAAFQRAVFRARKPKTYPIPAPAE